MTNPITDARKELASFIHFLVPSTPVFPFPPTNLTAPCIIVSFRESRQTNAGIWHQVFRVSFIGPAGDNEAAMISLEEMLWKVAAEVSRNYKTKVEWKVPSTITSSEQVYLTTSFDVVIDIT